MANLFNTAHHAAHGLNPVAALINGAMNTNTGHTGYGFNPFTAVANGVTQFGKVLLHLAAACKRAQGPEAAGRTPADRHRASAPRCNRRSRQAFLEALNT